ncbi:hypothetical protein FACS1894201_06880 [Bacteroidia bacterium]|nr:hypothetical protein FACS1894201_06880 [Bacteroidia bacterium]
MDFFTRYGYPISRNKRLSILHIPVIDGAINILTTHFVDSVKIARVSPILLKAIANGNCEPDIYGAMIDKRQQELRKPVIYGIAVNITPDEIIDYPNLDKRRMSIGLPPLEIAQERNRLLEELYGF